VLKKIENSFIQMLPPNESAFITVIDAAAIIIIPNLSQEFIFIEFFHFP
jgi:hypothetical protein